MTERGPSNEGFTHRSRIDGGDGGRTLLEYLADRYRHSTVDEWRERIESGEVRVDAAPASPGLDLRAGQEVAWHRPPWAEPVHRGRAGEALATAPP